MRETTNYYTSSNYADHSTFGGILYNFDYDGCHTLKSMSDRIIADWKFDEKCRKNAENRNKSYKKGTN